MIKEVLKEGLDECLGPFKVLEDRDLTVNLIQDLDDTIETLDRCYLCSNEIGYKERAFCIKFEDDCRTFFNPVFKTRDKAQLIREKDPITGKEFIIPRYREVSIISQNSLGKETLNKFKEEAAYVVCQAIDCLDGLHPADYGLEILPEFDEATDEERAEVVGQYVKALNEAMSNLDKELTDDKDTTRAWTYYKFCKAKALGEVEIEKDPVQQPNRKTRRFIDKLLRRGKKNVSKNNDSK